MPIVRDLRRRFGVVISTIASCALAGLVAAAAVVAPSGKVRLAWVRAEGASLCPAVEAVRDNVGRKLGWNPFDDGAPKSFEVVARRSDRVWIADIYSYDAQRGTSGFRQVRSDANDCRELVDAVALALALAIDPEATLGAPAGPRPSPRMATPEPGPLPPAAVPRAWHSMLTARGLAAVGALPRFALGAAIAATVDGPSRLALSTGAFLLPNVRTEPNAPVFGFGITAGWLDGCFVLHQAANTDVRACSGLRLGALHAVVYTPAPTDPGDRVWSALGASFAADQRLFGSVFIEVGLEATVPLLRYRFFAENLPGVIFEQPPVFGSGFVGIGFRID